MRDAEMSIGVIKATACAGPVFLVSYFIVDAVAGNAPVVLSPAFALAPVLLFFSAILGSLFAILPVLLGTATLTLLGRGNLGSRHPAVWALTGAAMTGPWPRQPDDPAAVALMLTAAICALLARSGVRWLDAEPT